jgi:hypothetical protein
MVSKASGDRCAFVSMSSNDSVLDMPPPPIPLAQQTASGFETRCATGTSVSQGLSPIEDETPVNDSAACQSLSSTAASSKLRSSTTEVGQSITC